jgi:2-methylcitrate dehydratase PrpD
MRISEQLADFIVKTEYQDIPSDAIEKAKTCVLDFFGVALAGSVQPISDVIKGYLLDKGGNPQSSIVGLGFKTTRQNAAFANGSFGHVLDYDDSNQIIYGHPTVTILPATLAIGEHIKASGKSIITAYVLGIETIGGIASGVMPSHYSRGWHATSTLGTFGAAAAAGKLLNLNVEEMSYALGIAGSLASGLQENHGTMTKAFHAGQSAEDGTMAALLAEKGSISSKKIFEGETGVCKVMSDEYKPEAITANLGKRWHTSNQSIKYYSSPFWSHQGLEAILSMVDEYNVDSENVVSVKYGVQEKYVHPVFVRELSNKTPQTPLEGKFSHEYWIATALLERKAGIEQFTTEKVKNPKAIEIMKNVELFVDPEIEKRDLTSNALAATSITLKLKDGKEYYRKIKFPKGSPEKPLSDNELIEKFRSCAKLVNQNEKTDAIIQPILNLEKVDNISTIMEKVCFNNI